jgi:hypothetical protein
MANEIYNKSWWGNPTTTWGNIYYDYAITSEVPSLLSTLQARADYYENVTCTTATLTELENIE